MSSNTVYASLSRRERQIMDVLHEENPISAKDIQLKMPDPPSYSAVRALITRMVDKGVVAFSREGTKYMYRPVQAQNSVQASAISRLLKTFFKGSKIKAVTALLDADGAEMDAHEIEELERKIARLKKQSK
ncbi:BlaI/MecI/CopY family transcriptional regulator [Marinagarivorans cellulosilyticus]|nr:BlaI/MecI/CopY family transcriptional regulator [Marinagarivorans cellulosilyticus]